MGTTVMVVAGNMGTEDVCLIQNAGALSLEPCFQALAAGDGRELWTFLGGGQLMNVASKKCASSTAQATSLAMSECNGASVWKMLPNGQMQVGDKCLSESGEGVGTENVAAHAAAAATSSADSVAHTASAAVDTDDATFWASRPGESEPVTLTIDLGEARSVDLMKISWQFPAESFVISVSVDGRDWTEVFSTAINMLKVNRIKSLAVLAPRLAVALDDCGVVSQSRDARDKYFAVSVADYNFAPSAALRSELPALAAAKASLSKALSEVVDAGQKLPGCVSMAVLSAGSQGRVGDVGSVHRAVESGVDEVDVKMLLATARSVIVATREALR